MIYPSAQFIHAIQKGLMLWMLVFTFLAAHPLHAQEIVFKRASSQALPIIELAGKKAAIIGFSNPSGSDPFTQMVNNYIPAKAVRYPQDQAGLGCFNYLIIKVNHTDEGHLSGFMQEYLPENSTCLLVFTYPPDTGTIEQLKHYDLLYSLNDSVQLQEAMAKMIFGGKPLPGSHSPTIRLDYGMPEEAGMKGEYLRRTVDSIVQRGIELKAFPGCQVLVARKGTVVLNKSYGHHTYSGETIVENDDVYDLASISKIFGATLSLMKMADEGLIDLDKPFHTYWKPFKRKDKKEITLRELLAHQAGLVPYLPFYTFCYTTNGSPDKKSFRYTLSNRYNIEIYHQMFAHRKYRKQLYASIAGSPVKEKRYRYSDLSFLLYPEVVKSISGLNFDAYLYTHFYAPLGAQHLMFTPSKYLSLNKIIPTEHDEYFRYTLVRGYVHDESAAMLGGISGNAGVFGNANDMAKVLQMLLQGGAYGGKRYLSKNIVREFTRLQYPDNNNRRGLGFDKPLIGNDTLPLEKAYPAPEVSPESYGHSGFTGTFFWVDPANQTIYVLLTNRVYPTRNNNALGKYNIRYTIQQAIYTAIHLFEQEKPTQDQRLIKTPEEKAVTDTTNQNK